MNWYELRSPTRAEISWKEDDAKPLDCPLSLDEIEIVGIYSQTLLRLLLDGDLSRIIDYTGNYIIVPNKK